jgi:hypothetical protein
MIEEIFYLDEGHIEITAASIGISSRRWSCINASEVNDENYRILMRDNRYDVLPIVSDQGIREFFKTEVPNQYDKILREIITYKDVLPLNTTIRDVIKGFVAEIVRFIS